MSSTQPAEQPEKKAPEGPVPGGRAPAPRGLPQWARLLSGPVGRLAYALPFAVFGLMHLGAAPQLAPVVPDFVGGGVFWVYFTGVAMLAAVVGIAFNTLLVPACLGLALLLAVFVLTIHVPALVGGAPLQPTLTNLLKDIALAGGALMAMRAVRAPG